MKAFLWIVAAVWTLVEVTMVLEEQAATFDQGEGAAVRRVALAFLYGLAWRNLTREQVRGDDDGE